MKKLATLILITLITSALADYLKFNYDIATGRSWYTWIITPPVINYSHYHPIINTPLPPPPQPRVQPPTPPVTVTYPRPLLP